MKTYYLILCKGLTGCYMVYEAASIEDVQRHAAENFSDMWTSVCSEAYFREIICKRYPKGTRVINRNKPIKL